jgi:hypothetical protein
MKKLLACLGNDLRLSFRSWYIYMEFMFALIFVAVIAFVVPEEIERSVTVYAWIDAPAAIRQKLDESVGREGLELVPVDSPEELRERLGKDKSGVGLSIAAAAGKPEFTYTLQGYESATVRNVLKASVESGFATALPGYRDVTETTILQGAKEVLPLRMNMIPVFLALNSAFMGLFIIAAYIFLDKLQGTIRALAVTTATVRQYLASKCGVMLVTGIGSGMIATVLLAGTSAHYAHLLALLVATNAFGSALGLFIASFFDSMTSAMSWLFASIMALSVSTISYYLPAFSPLAIRLLPSYPMLFAFREVLLESPDLGYVYMNVAGFCAAAAALFLLADRRFRKNLTG